MSFFEKESRVLNALKKDKENKEFVDQKAVEQANARIARERAREIAQIQEARVSEEQQKQQDSVIDASMAKEALPEASKVVAKDTTLSSAQKEDIVTKASNPSTLHRTAKDLNNTADSDKKESSTPADNFRDALTFFAPQLLGGVLGGALEGVEGAVAGSVQGGKLRDSYIDYKTGQQEMQLKRDALQARGGDDKRTFQQSSQFMTRDEKPLSYDTRSGKFYDMDGNEVSSDNVVNQIQGRHEDTLSLKGQQLSLGKQKFGYEQVKGSQLSDAQTKAFSEIKTVENSINRIEELRKQVNSTGPLAGRVQSLAQYADLAPESFNKMKVQTASTLSNYVKSISGAQVSVQEAVRLEAIIPSVTDAPDVFQDKLQEFEKIVKMNKEAFAEAIESGQPLKAGTIRGLMAAEKKFKGATTKSRLSPKEKSSYKDAIQNATSMEEINKIKQQYGYGAK